MKSQQHYINEVARLERRVAILEQKNASLQTIIDHLTDNTIEQIKLSQLGERWGAHSQFKGPQWKKKRKHANKNQAKGADKIDT